MNNSEDGSRIDNVTSDEILGILNHSTLFDAIILDPCALPGEKSKKSADEFRQQYQEAMSKVKRRGSKIEIGYNDYCSESRHKKGLPFG